MFTVTAFIVHGGAISAAASKATVYNDPSFHLRFHKFVVYRTCLAGPPCADHVRDIMFRLANRPILITSLSFERYAWAQASAPTSTTTKTGYLSLVTVIGSCDSAVQSRCPARQLDVTSLSSSHARSVGGRLLFARISQSGLNRHFGIFTMRFLASQGYTEEFGVIVATNIPSRRSVLHRGSQFVYFVSTLDFCSMNACACRRGSDELRATAKRAKQTRPQGYC